MPLQGDLARVQPVRLEIEAPEERGHHADRFLDDAEDLWMLLLQAVEECGQIATIRTEVNVIGEICGLFDFGRDTGVMEVVDFPTQGLKGMLYNGRVFEA